MNSQAPPTAPPHGRTIAYWVTTVLVVLVLGSGGVYGLLRRPPVAETVTQLGYPVYFCVILGVWEVMGVIALLIPGTPRLKEWAYAGTFVDLTAAAASHFAMGDNVGKVATPLVLTVLVISSWALRPASRRLQGPLL
jgi:uncharacterized membrane protein YphA (DoxX/SURF4 family)